MQIWSMGREDPLEEGMRIPWTEEPGELDSIGSQRVRHDWSGLAHIQPNIHGCIFFQFYTVSRIAAINIFNNHCTSVHLIRRHFKNKIYKFYSVYIQILMHTLAASQSCQECVKVAVISHSIQNYLFSHLLILSVMFQWMASKGR